MLPSNQIALRIQPGAQGVIEQRPILSGAHIVLARPLHFDRCTTVDGFRNLHCFQHIVGAGIGATTEAAAGIQHVDFDLLGFDAEEACDIALVAGLILLTIPNFALIVTEFDHAVQRLHGSMR